MAPWGSSWGSGSNDAAGARTSPYDQSQSKPMTLWVGNLPDDWKDPELKEKFSKFGEIQSVKVLIDMASGASKGCGFVNFTKPEDAMAAIEGLGDSGLMVKIKDEPSGKGKGKGSKGGEAPKDNLYVMGLPVNCDPQVLGEIFKKFNVMRSRILPRSEGHDETHAMVQLASEAEAQAAHAELHGKPIPGIELPKGSLNINFAGKNSSPDAQKGGWTAGAAGGKSSGKMSLTVRYSGSAGAQEPSPSLYVLGLPAPQIDEPTLRMIFTNLGLEVKRTKVLPASAGQGHSCALVEVGNEEEAASAISSLNGQTLICEEVRAANGEAGGPVKLTVNYAGNAKTPSDNIFISGLPSPKVDEAALKQMFEGMELNVTSMKTIPDTKGFGFSQALVRLESEEQAATAIALLHGDVCPIDAVAKNKLGVKYQFDEPSDSIYMTGLPAPQVSISSLKEVFSALELTVQRCKVIADTKGYGQSCALVQLGSQEEATKAIELMNGEVCDDFKADVGGGQGSWNGTTPPVKVVYQGNPPTPSDNLYIANLPSPQTTDASIKALIEGIECTYKRSKLIPDSKGWGLCAAMVQVGSQEEAQKVIDELNGQALSGEDMKALAPNSSPHVDAGVKNGKATISVQFAGQAHTPSDNLYMTGLPTTADEQVLRNLFAGMSMTVQRVKLIPDTKGYGSCAAMVQLGSLEEATKAIESLHGETFTLQDFNTFANSAAAVGTAGVKAANSGASAAAAEAGSTLTVRYGGSAEVASENVFIGGLPVSIDESTLKQLLEALGVTVQRMKILPDTKKTGKLSAMVKLADNMEASLAIEQLNGEVFPEDLVTSPAQAAPQKQWSQQQWEKPQQWTSQTQNQWTQQTSQQWTQQKPEATKNTWSNGSGDGMVLVYAGKQQTPSANLYMSQLPAPDTTEEVLRSVFEAAGLSVVRLKVNADTKGYGKCTAMIEVGSQEEAANAIEMFTGKPLSSASTGASPNAQTWEEPPAKKAKVEVKAEVKAEVASNGAHAAKPKAAASAEVALSVRYAGKKGADGKVAPSDYIVLSGFSGAVPPEDDVKGVLCGFNVNVKRLRIQNNQLMIQVGSVEEAGVAIQNLDQWPWPAMEEPWPEC